MRHRWRAGGIEAAAVAEGDVVVVLEAMKMENPVRATVAGSVSALHARVGQVIPAGTVLAEISPAES